MAVSNSIDRFNGIVASKAIKVRCRVASTANVPLPAGQAVVDTVTLDIGDRVLLKDQTDPTENGIYCVRESAWERSPDWDGNRDIATGSAVFAGQGAGQDLLYQVTVPANSNNIVIGTDAVTIAETPLGRPNVPVVLLDGESFDWGDAADVSMQFDGTSFVISMGAVDEFILADSAVLTLEERVAAVAALAGRGYFWVRSDVPNVPVFTDDDGNDFVLNLGQRGITLADIPVGDPPTTEAVTGFFQVRDSDETTQLCRFGFDAASNRLSMSNRMQGGSIFIGYIDSLGVGRIALEHDPVGEVDGDFASVVFLSTFDGPDAATAATDISVNGAGSPHAMTFVGNAQLDTSQSLFGTSALLLDGTGDWLTVPDSADWHMAGGNFTIDARIRLSVHPTGIVSFTIVSHYEPNSGGRSFSFDYNNNSGTPQLRFFYSTDGLANNTFAADFTMAINTWYEVSFSRIGTVGRLAINGNQVGGNFDMSTDILFDSPHVLTIGALGRTTGGPTSPFFGWIEDLRITKGVGRYAGDYTTIADQFPTNVGFNGLTIGGATFRNRIQNSLFYKELADAPLDVDGYGQVWVRDDNVLMFTADDGVDIQVSSGALGGLNGAKAFGSGNQTISDATPTVVAFNSESYDTAAIHDNATNNSRLTVPVGVTRIKLTAYAKWAANGSAFRFMEIRKNGAGGTIDDDMAGYEPSLYASAANASVPLLGMQLASGTITVVATDYFELRVEQTSGGNLDLLAGDYWMEMEIVA